MEPKSTLPKKIQQDADKAAQLIKDNQQRKTDDATAHQPLNPGDGPTGGAPKKNTPPPEPPAPADKDKTATPPDPAPAKSIDWEHKYNVLKGKYDKEVLVVGQQQNTTIANLQTQVAQLSTQLLELRDQPPGPAPQGKPGRLDPKMYEDYGPEFVEMANRLNMVFDNTAKLQDTTEQSRHDSFWMALRGAVDGVDDINKDPEFLEWLNGFMTAEDGSKRLRNTVLRDAYQQADVTNVAKVFRLFIQEKNQPPNNQPPTQEPGQAPPAPSPTPAESGSAPLDSSGGQKRTYTRQQVKEFFSNMAQGKYSKSSDTAQWAANMQADIIAAANEGRII